MKTQTTMILMTVVSAIFCACVQETPNLLPKPQSVEWSRGRVKVDKVRTKFSSLQGGDSAETEAQQIPQAAQIPQAPRLSQAAQPPQAKAGGVDNGGTASEVPGRARPQSEEAYKLVVAKDGITIFADTDLGRLRARQTLDQLTIDGKARCCTISDAPAYQWRGVMLDVSRHFLTIDFLKKHIDILASYKINRLHLHLTDAAGWRMEIKKYPLLTKVAAWRPQETWKEWWSGDRHYAEEGTQGAYGGYYTQDQLRDLVAYASGRGVLIVPEIEMPAHSEEVLAVYPEISCTHEPYKQADFCIGNDATFEFLENVLAEVMDVFPSEYIHIGGDEAGKLSWSGCPLCQARMKMLGLKDVDALQAHLIEHFGNFLKARGRKLIGWDEVLDETLTDNSTVMVWRGADIIRKAASMGLDVIASPGAYCYIDSYQDDPPSQPEAIGGYLTLEKVYSFDPLEGLSPEQATRVQGIQANLWAEYIPTPEHREYMLYPRALAIAEIGWNGSASKDFQDFRSRALVETQKLRSSGVNAFDLKDEVGDRAESKAPVKHKALGAPVQYNIPFNEYYPGAGPSTLTDGLRGGWNNNDGRWQGFIKGKRLDVVLDLGRKTEISKVAADFLQICGPEIFFPAEFSVSVSDTGETGSFTELAHQRTPVVKTTNPDARQWTWEGNASGRYVRIQASAGEFGGWIFIDEIEVY